MANISIIRWPVCSSLHYSAPSFPVKNKVITTMVIRPLDDPNIYRCSISSHLFSWSTASQCVVIERTALLTVIAYLQPVD